MPNVYLVLYRFKIEGLIKATHTEIAIDNMSIGYGETGIEVLVPQNLNGHDGYRLIRSIPLGRTRKNIREIRNEGLKIVRMDIIGKMWVKYRRNYEHLETKDLKK